MSRVFVYALFALVLTMVAASLSDKRVPDVYAPARAAEKAMDQAAVEACLAKPGTDEALYLRSIYLSRASIFNTRLHDLLVAGYYYPGASAGVADLESVCADRAAELARARKALLTAAML